MVRVSSSHPASCDFLEFGTDDFCRQLFGVNTTGAYGAST